MIILYNNYLYILPSTLNNNIYIYISVSLYGLNNSKLYFFLYFLYFSVRYINHLMIFFFKINSSIITYMKILFLVFLTFDYNLN